MVGWFGGLDDGAPHCAFSEGKGIFAFVPARQDNDDQDGRRTGQGSGQAREPKKEKTAPI